MQNNKSILDDSAVELIKAIALNPKSLNALIDASIQQASLLGKKEISEEEKSRLRSLFLSSAFLKQYTEPFAKIFNAEEVSSLLAMYRSDEMNKMLEHSSQLFSPLYQGIREQIDKASNK